VFVIVRKRFLCNTILGNLTGKVGIMDEKNNNSGAICPEKNKLNNKTFSLKL